jgi:CDP-glucose 4,6-dehydratase
MNKNFWKNKKVLITGINGFIGSNLCKKLLSLGANVTGLLRNKNEKTLLFVEKLNKKVTLVNGNLENKNNLKRILLEQNIEICFHLAAQVEVGIAEQDPFVTWETNIKGTYCLMEAIREQKKKLKAIVIASSDKAYGNYPRNKMPYKEDYELKAKYPYDVSKACSDMIARSYASDLYNLPVVITRFANIYGPGQANFSALIPDCMKAIIKNEKFIPRGNGNNIRDFLYVEDVAELYLSIGKKIYLKPKKIKGEIFNAGTNKPLKVKNIIKIIFKHENKENRFKKIEKMFKNKKTSGELDFQYMDYKKVKFFFGWTPKTDFITGISKTITWYKKNISKIL